MSYVNEQTRSWHPLYIPLLFLISFIVNRKYISDPTDHLVILSTLFCTMGLNFNSSQTSQLVNAKKNSCADAAMREAFQILTTTLLTLLLPLSFLLLARLATAHYFLSISDNYPTPHPTSFLCSLFLYTKPTILHLLVSLISISTLTHGLTGNITFLSQQPLIRSRLYAAWIFLCILQICVGLGIEGSIAAGIDGSGFGQEKSLLCRVLFFFGLHETTRFWWRTVVKSVVDDTIFGVYRTEEGWVVKVAMGLSFGGLWWWRLREEVEALVVVTEVKRELMMGIGVADFVGWWLYYITVTIGMVRIVNGLIWVVMILVCRRGGGGGEDTMIRPNDEKV